MTNRACVYILNENQMYHGMFSVSLRTLRRSNPGVPVILFYVRDGNADSWHKNTDAMRSAFDQGMVSRFMIGGEARIMELCRRESVRVELVERLPYATQNFVSIQRCLFEKCHVRDALLLDVDTFVFGPVDPLFDTRGEIEVAASPMVGVFGDRGGVTSQDIIFSYMVGGRLVKSLVRPMNSGVVLFRNHLISEYGSVVKQYCDLLLGKKHPMSYMMYSMRPDGRSREEFAFNVYLLERRKRTRFFENSEVCTYDYRPGCLVFHSSSAAYPSHFASFCRAGRLVPN